MRTSQKRVALWMLFAVIQTCGVVIPRYTNIHSNIWSVFGLLLLAPGIAAVAVVGLAWGVAIAVPVNAALWYWVVDSIPRNSNSER